MEIQLSANLKEQENTNAVAKIILLPFLQDHEFNDLEISGSSWETKFSYKTKNQRILLSTCSFNIENMLQVNYIDEKTRLNDLMLFRTHFFIPQQKLITYGAQQAVAKEINESFPLHINCIPQRSSVPFCIAWSPPFTSDEHKNIAIKYTHDLRGELQRYVSQVWDIKAD